MSCFCEEVSDERIVEFDFSASVFWCGECFANLEIEEEFDEVLQAFIQESVQLFERYGEREVEVIRWSIEQKQKLNERGEKIAREAMNQSPYRYVYKEILI